MPPHDFAHPHHLPQRCPPAPRRAGTSARISLALHRRRTAPPPQGIQVERAVYLALRFGMHVL
jgi:hypothetical protein